jgi:hypothetical protein
MMKRLIISIALLLSVTTLAHARTYMFRDKPSNIKRWMNAKGCGGSTFDSMMCYFTSLSNISNGTLYDHVNDVLTQNGCSGTMEDKVSCFFSTKKGDGGRDGERAFWQDDSQTFEVAAGTDVLLLETGDRILLETGDGILIE